MKMTLQNQKPAVLDPVHLIPISGDYDPFSAMRKVVVDPVFTPLVPGATVSLTDDAGNAWGPDELLTTLGDTQGEKVDLAAENVIRQVMAQALVSYDGRTPLLASSIFPIQAGASLRPPLPAPGPGAIYTAGTDVLPAVKKMLAGTGSEAELLASLAYTYSPQTLGFWFRCEADFDDAKAWIATQAAALGPVLPADTAKLLSDFDQLRLNNLTEGLTIRADSNDQNQEYSFARVIVHLLMQYARQSRTQSPDAAGVLPLHLGELFIPRTIVMVNLEIHARSSARKVDNEWRLINATLASPVKVVSTSALSKLTALPRAAAKAAMAASAANSGNALAPNGRSAKITFRKRPPTSVDLYKGVIRALMRMKKVAHSQNIFKSSSTSYMKASRRDPDDYNRPGRIVKTVYLPDVHIYLDCSGSISESDYQVAVQMLIALAKKLNVNLYFSSFSHMLSQEVMLRTSGRSVPQIWEEFRRIPKVGGGTDYEPIWSYIQASVKRRARFNLILSDFEYTAPTNAVEHPKNLYYAPIISSDWGQAVHWAKYFTQSMRHIEPAIAQRLIGVAV